MATKPNGDPPSFVDAGAAVEPACAAKKAEKKSVESVRGQNPLGPDRGMTRCTDAALTPDCGGLAQPPSALASTGSTPTPAPTTSAHQDGDDDDDDDNDVHTSNAPRFSRHRRCSKPKVVNVLNVVFIEDCPLQYEVELEGLSQKNRILPEAELNKQFELSDKAVRDCDTFARIAGPQHRSTVLECGRGHRVRERNTDAAASPPLLVPPPIIVFVSLCADVSMVNIYNMVGGPSCTAQQARPLKEMIQICDIFHNVADDIAANDFGLARSRFAKAVKQYADDPRLWLGCVTCHVLRVRGRWARITWWWVAVGLCMVRLSGVRVVALVTAAPHNSPTLSSPASSVPLLPSSCPLSLLGPLDGTR